MLSHSDNQDSLTVFQIFLNIEVDASRPSGTRTAHAARRQAILENKDGSTLGDLQLDRVLVQPLKASQRNRSMFTQCI